MEGRLVRALLRLWAVGVLAFLFVPIVTICVYAFNSSVIQTWPITGLTVRWFTVAWHDPQVRAALWLSVRAGLAATAVALVLGSAAAFGVHRFRFFGREAVSLLLVLPISLPGIITGIALNSAFGFAGIGLSVYTIIIGHATFCIVVVYNNVLARLRRMSGSVYEAAADLGAHGWFTFRTVTMPMLSTALVSGALLAFALSFDEVIVTTFTAGAQNTLPLWIFGAIRLGQQLPEVNVVVTVVLVLTLIPVAVAARLTGGGGITRTSVRAAVGAGPAVAGAGPAAESAVQTPAAPAREPIP
jgi:putative spermidine/putrescine transport system permease protein